MGTDHKRALEHIRYVAHTIGQEVEKKGLRGQKEHGGNIDRKNVLPMLLEECWDLPFYAVCLRDTLADVKDRLLHIEHELSVTVTEYAETPIEGIERESERARAYFIMDRVQRALHGVNQVINMLTIGNPEGLPEEER